jgi:carbon starvation protein
MNSLHLLLISIVAFLLAYKFYGKILDRLYGINNQNKTPAHTDYDGVDYVPAKNKLILFGHHFSSICGAGPIIGPVLAVTYWGWGPSVIWILLGSILMGAVADYSSLVMGMRSHGKSVAEVAKPEISPRSRILFSWFIWITVILVIAVFALFGAKTLVQEKTAVLPSMGLIPTAILVGWLLYQKRIKTLWGTLIGLFLLGSLLLGGQFLSITLPEIFGLSEVQLWIIILLIYCIFASTSRVDLLLQPRDYLASFLLFITIGIGMISIVFTQPEINLPVFYQYNPVDLWPNSGPMFPMLFVIIACGAISGFHSLVASGTTCKQIDQETHACNIGYGGMLTEGLVAILVVICVIAGLSQARLDEILKTSNSIAAFSEGYGNLSSFLLGDYGKSFAVLALNTFILTTLDSATRIARYLTMDLFKIKSKYLSTIIVIILAGALAFSGQWKIIWPVFGTANQLIAGLSLLVASCWLLHRKKPVWFTLIPSLLMLVITTVAFILQIIRSLSQENPDYLIAGVSLVLIGLSFIVYFEAIQIVKNGKIKNNIKN